MMQVLNVVLFLGTIVFIIPCIVFCLECISALFSKQTIAEIGKINRPQTAILVPAHNEAAQIRPVLETALKQLTEQDRLLVIADNCSDDTAAIARQTGATVIERTNLNQRGKGYALDYGLQHIQADPPEVVVILDADCLIEPGTIERITRQAQTTGRPTQATYLMEQPDDPSLKDRISMFALKVKNLVRLQGLKQLGWHSLLTGSGMAFPWSVIGQVDLAGSKTTDDMQLAVDLAIAGCTPTFCPQAQVMGRLMKAQDAQSQRSRWEHGHLEMILVEVPRLLKAFFQKGRFDLLTLALDILIPPLSLLIMAWLGLTAIATLAAILGASLLPTIIVTSGGSCLLLALLGVWWRFGRSDLPVQNLVAIPVYIFSKIPIYLKFLTQPQSRWLRTERDR